MNFKPAKIPSNDALRVKAVQRTGVLDENKTELYDIYCFLAKEITGCPVSWTGVIDSKKPVGNCILTCFNYKQALARKNKGKEAALALNSILYK